jgi:hydrogenase large subunit
MCHEMAAVFGARLPHSTAMIPGGCTEQPTMERILAYRSRLQRIMSFVKSVHIPDLFRVAEEFPEYFDIGAGCGNFLCFGNFPMDESGAKFIQPGVVIGDKWEPLKPELITEEVACSRYSSRSGLHPSQGETIPAPDKNGAYSWGKAARYQGRPMEVGALARIMTNYLNPNTTWIKKEIDQFLEKTKIPAKKLVSVLGRHVARGLESLWIAKQAFHWLDEIEIGEPATRDFSIPKSASGYGLMEAPRGALGHWLTIENHLIKNYQCVVPTTWNCSPRDDRGQAGPVEQAIEGTHIENPAQPIEIGRIVRSFDPCLACSIH